MNSKLVHFEKYSVAPCPSRDYYGIKVFSDEVILYLWKISHGPHLFPIVRVTKFSDFDEEKLLKDEIQQIFGSTILKYVELINWEGTNTLLTLPRNIIEKLIKYLNLKDIVNLFCISQVSNEIFNTNAIWEILFKRLKGSLKLTEMEKDLSISQGFKKLAKDQHVRNATKKTLKSLEDKFTRSQKTTERSEKIMRSASVNIPKISLQNDVKNVTKKQSIDSSSRKVKRQSKSPVKVPNRPKEKNFDLPKKYMSEEKSSFFMGNQSFNENHAAGEGNTKLVNKTATKNKILENGKLNKFQFINEDREKTELLLQKEYMKSVITQTNLSDIGSEEMIRKNSVTRSPRSIFTKHSNHALQEIKTKSRDKMPEQRKSRGLKSKITNATNFDLKTLINDDKTEDSDGSGMSYLMKRYLETSDEAARKFSECERLIHSTKYSGTQVNISEKSVHKPTEKMQKYLPSVEKSISRNTGNAANMFTKLKSLKKY